MMYSVLFCIPALQGSLQGKTDSSLPARAQAPDFRNGTACLEGTIPGQSHNES